MADQWGQGGYDGSRPGGAGDSFGDLDSFGGEYKADAGGFNRGIDQLADGDYDLEITAAALERTQKTGDTVCRIILRVIGGRTVEWTHWLNRQADVNRFCAELAALGFDAHLWGPAHNRPLSREIPAAVARINLAGIKFRGHKSSRKDERPLPPAGQGTGKTFHDLSVSCRLDGRPMPPLTPPTAAPNGQRPAAPVPADAGVPF